MFIKRIEKFYFGNINVKNDDKAMILSDFVLKCV